MLNSKITAELRLGLLKTQSNVSPLGARGVYTAVKGTLKKPIEDEDERKYREMWNPGLSPVLPLRRVLVSL